MFGVDSYSTNPPNFGLKDRKSKIIFFNVKHTFPVLKKLLKSLKTRICRLNQDTYTPEKDRLEEIKQRKQLKKQTQERKLKAKKIKRALNLLLDADTMIEIKNKPKTLGTDVNQKKKLIKIDNEDKSEYEDETDCKKVLLLLNNR